MDKVIIFGASILGEVAFNCLKDDYNICFFSDNDIKKHDTLFCDKKIISPEELLNYKDYKIIIASMYFMSISEQLINLGLENVYCFLCNKTGNYKQLSRNFKYKILPATKFDFSETLYVNFDYEKIKSDYREAFLKKEHEKITPNINYGEKNVLIFSLIFPPLGGPGVQRTLKYVKYLKKLGWNPIVVTCDEYTAFDMYDDSLLLEVDEDVSIIRIKTSFLPFSYRDTSCAQECLNLISGVVCDNTKMDRFMSELKTSNLKDRHISCPDPYITWVNDVLKNIEYIVDFNKIDVIYTTSYPYSSSYIGYYLKNRFNVPWVCDFRDEWTNTHFPVKHNFIAKTLENNVLKNCDALICVAPATIDNYARDFEILKENIYCITNGYDEDDFSGISLNPYKSDVFTIKHNGIFYIDMTDPYCIIIAVNELINEGKICKHKILIELTGAIPELIKNRCIELDKNNILIFKDYMPHKQSLENLSNSHLIFMVSGNNEKTKKSIILGKLFEYLRVKRNILAFTPNDSVLADIINDTNAGKCCEMSDIQSAKEIIFNYYESFLNDSIEYYGDYNEVKQFSRENLTKKLIEIFENVKIKYK